MSEVGEKQAAVLDNYRGKQIYFLKSVIFMLSDDIKTVYLPEYVITSDNKCQYCCSFALSVSFSEVICIPHKTHSARIMLQ